MAYKNKADAVEYNNRFIAKKYDRINLTVPKGRKAELQAAADRTGEKVNGLINRLIAAELERLGIGKPPAVKVDPQQPDTKSSAGGNFHSSESEAAPHEP